MPSPIPANSLHAMAEDIFDLSVMAWRDRVASKTSATAELTESQFLTLDLLQKQSPQAVGELQRAIGVLPAQMSRIIRSLEQHFETPLIHCALNPQDKRKIDVTMTPLGQKIYTEFRQARLAKTIELIEKLPENDRLEFVRIIRQIKDLNRSAPSSAKP